MSATVERTALRWDYAPAPESRDAARIAPSYDLFIGGEFVAPRDGRRAPTVNPATEEKLAEIAFAGPGDVERAIEGRPRGRLRSGRGLPALERGKYLFRIARLIQERARELAVVESLDGGKPIRESRDVDIPAWPPRTSSPTRGGPTRSAMRWAAGSGARAASLGQIIPWNFPLLMAAWKLGPALACGNTAILKPAETTPLTSLLLAEICQEAELPEGVVNIVTGDGTAGAALVRAEGIDKDRVHRLDRRRQGHPARAGRPPHLLTLELGGKSANIVFEDAALDQAVEGIIEGIFFNQGHVCCAGSRLLLQESVADEVLRKLWERMERLRVGDPLDKNTDVGAINSREQLDRIEALVAEGEREGADAALDLLRAARRRVLVPSDAVHRRRAGEPDRGRGDLRPGRLGHHVPLARRGDRARQQLGLRAGRRRVDRQRLQGVRGRFRAAGRRRVGRTPTTASTRRPRSAATRRAASAARAAQSGLLPYVELA
jgi:aldehyde dehydrogenase (NAD+)